MKVNKKKMVLALSGLSVLGTCLSTNVLANTELEEIVVTAQRRAESLQDASVSIDVLTADSLEKAGVSQAIDLGRIAPGVQVTNGGTSIQIYIRGAGDFSTTSYNDAAVAQNFDGVPAARSQYINGTFFDLERIEILKGPQGTLYGRNATGGALNIIPKRPELDSFSGYVSAGLQNYDGSNVEGAFNAPINETSAMRASFQVVNREGYIDDGTDDDKHNSFRLQYLYDNNDDLTLNIAGNYQHFGGRGPGNVVWIPKGTVYGGPIKPSNPWTSINDSLNGFIGGIRDGSLPGPPVLPSFSDTSKVQQDMTAWGIHAQLDWQLDIGTLTLIPAYQYVENSSQSMPALNFRTYDLSGNATTSDGKSFEARLTNETDKLKWVAGAFYFNEEQDSRNYVDLAFVADLEQPGSLETEAYALFGEVNYSFTDRFRGILGLRYTDESKSVDAAQYAVFGSAQCQAAGTGPLGSCLTLKVDGDYQVEKVNYRLGFEYDLGEDSMLFATIATGFKSGGQVNAALPPYDPELLTAYTIGSKNRFFDGTVQFNAEIFYIDYKDHQENLSTRDSRGVRVSSLDNAGTATSKGVSLDTKWLVTDNDFLRAAVEYNDTVYDEFIYHDYTARQPTTTECLVNPATAASPVGATWAIDCSGFQMARAPEWSGNVSYTHTFKLANGGSVDVTPDMTFASSRWLRASFNKNQLADSYQLFNLSATYNAPNDQYSVQLFVRNLTEEAVYTGSELAPFVTDYTAQVIGAPRTFGARVRVNF